MFCAVAVLLAVGLVRAEEEETPGAALERIVEAGKVINVHEHIQGEGNVGQLLAAMDSAGIAKTVLVGSSWFTLALYERAGFSRYDENNEVILGIANAQPERFEAWPTVRPEDPDMLEKLRDLVARGAKGVKLYIGHGYTTRRNEYMFHTMAMDDARLLPLYAYCAEQHLPLCIHVNPDKPGFADEFVAVLRLYPDLKVNCPHFMLSSGRLSRLRELLECFPNLYVDISFGHDDFLEDGLRRISGNHRAFRQLFSDFPERFFFGTDFVFTSFKRRSPEWARTRIQSYYDMLTRTRYETPLMEGRTLNGLALDAALLENLLYKNFERFRALEPEGTCLTRDTDWRNMSVRPVDRKPGEALPPAPRSPRRSRWGWSSGRWPD